MGTLGHMGRRDRPGIRIDLIAGAMALAICFCAAPFSPARADTAPAQSLTATEIVERAFAAAGGDLWRSVKTLSLAGHGTFWGKDGVVLKADDYRMWRVFEAERRVAHGPSGLVRIDSRMGDTVHFQVSFDGENTWTNRGLVPPEQAKTYWSNAFGFGVIRHALDAGFSVSLRPQDQVRGEAAHMVMVKDPSGGETLFGISAETYQILLVGFQTPRGWHVRHYSDFETLPNGWVQPGRVTLYYDGVKANEIVWTATEVNAPLAGAHFNLGKENTKGDTP